MTPGRLPTGGQYQAALQHPARCFTDPVLRDATPERTALGLPKPISGNFASVFPVTAPTGERYAVKCFTREAPHQLQRYELISARLHALRPRWAADFVFQPEGVRVEGVAYPVLRMDWIEAVTLTRWVDAAVSAWRDTGTGGGLDGLADRFDAVVGELVAAGIAHGDLQHGNVLVRGDGELRLVDYDGMYVPGLDGLPSEEVGHPNFQPPGRTSSDYGPAIDRFSARLISQSLRALAADPGLWDRCNPGHEEYLLLDQADFADPLGSKRLAEILGHGDPRVRELGAFVRDCLPLPLGEMPALEAGPSGGASGGTAPGRTRAPRAEAGGGTARAASALPAWMSGRVAPSSAAATPGPPGAEPVPDGLTPQGPVRAVWTVRVLTVLAVAAVATVVVGIAAAAPVMAAGGVAGVAVCAALAYAVYRREVGAAASGGGTVAGLEHRRDELDARVRELAEAYDRRRDDARRAYDAEAADQVRRRDALAAELAAVEAERREAGARLLVRRQQAHVADRLATTVLAPRDVDGLSALDVVHLRAAGITRPSDFTGVVHRQGRAPAPGARPVQEPYLQRPDGTEIKVTGIGEAKARRLEWWRNRHMVFARRDQPVRLAPDDEADLDARYAPRISAARDALDRAGADAGAAARADLTRTLGRLDADQRAELRPLTEERTEIGRALRAARPAVDAGPVVSLPRFVRAAWTAGQGGGDRVRNG